MSNKVPVFSKDRQIQGYLKVGEHEPRYSAFARRCRTPAEWTKINEVPSVIPASGLVGFTWTVLASARDSNTMYRCDVLIADKPESLGTIDGFEWFAEVHGQPQTVAKAV